MRFRREREPLSATRQQSTHNSSNGATSFTFFFSFTVATHRSGEGPPHDPHTRHQRQERAGQLHATQWDAAEGSPLRRRTTVVAVADAVAVAMRIIGMIRRAVLS